MLENAFDAWLARRRLPQLISVLLLLLVAATFDQLTVEVAAQEPPAADTKASDSPIAPATATLAPEAAVPGEGSAPIEAAAPTETSVPTETSGPTAAPATPPVETAIMTERTIIDLGDQPDQVTFTFQEAPWPEVLREFAQWAGLTLDLTDTPPGYFSYFDNRSHTPVEAIDILNGYLLPRGFVLLRRDQFLVALKTDNAMLANLIPTIDLADLANRGDNELIRTVIEVDEISPEVAAEEIRGLLGPFGAATPLESSQSLLMQGFGGTLRQAMEVLGKSKPTITDDKLDFRAFALKNLPASEAEQQIRVLFGIASATSTVNVSGSRSELDRAAYYRNREQNERDGKSRDSAPPPIPLLKKVAMNMQVSSLERTNSLLVTATPEGLLLVENVLKSIDVPQVGDVQRWANDTGPVLRVYSVDSADEGEVAKSLDVLMPGVVVNEDRRQDTIHVYATPKQHEEVARLINTLDQGEGGSRVVEVIPLRNANPVTAAALLTGMFANDDRDARPIIQAELPTRTVVVRGTAAQVSQVRDALVGLGEPAQATGAAGTDRVRRIAVGGRSAEAIAEATVKILSGDKQFRNSIRVVVPGQSRAQSVKPAPAPPTARSEASAKDSASTSGTMFADFKPVAMTKAEVGSETAPKDKKPAAGGTNEARPSVSIEVQGDQLLVYSGDPAALNDVEEMIRELIRQMPDRTKWTVFYLRVAEAEQAAIKVLDLTQNLNPQFSSSGSFQDQPPLRVVPDKRTNAIFVSGTPEQVDEVEGFLQYIDAADVPGSFLRREPHAIMVQYADVNQVAELLRTLYKDYLVDPVAERLRLERSSRSRDRDETRSQSSTSSTSSTGSANSASKSESPGIRLTLAVDSKTGELLVACNDQLFQEIEAVVKQRDLAVRDSQPTVEFIPITGATPPYLVEMLNGMSPRVKAETVLPSAEPGRSTGQGRSSSGNRGSSSGSQERNR